MYEYLDKRYALALYEVAEKKGKVEEYISDLKEICEFIDNDKSFQEAIDHPKVSTLKKKEVFTKLFKGQIDEELLSFLLILIEKGRIHYLKQKLNEMEKIHLEKTNTILANVKTAVPITDEQLNALKAKLENQYKKNIIIEAEVDKNILGGVFVKVGNNVIDGTVKSKLREMKDIMLKSE